MLDTEKFTYIVDMFRTPSLSHETPENPCVAPVSIQTIEAFMNRVGYQGVVDKPNPVSSISNHQAHNADLNEEISKHPQGNEGDYTIYRGGIPIRSVVYLTKNDACNESDMADSDANEDKEIEKETKYDDVEKADEVVNEKDIIDDVTGSMEIKKEHKQTPIPSPTRSPKNVSFSDKTGSIAGMCRRRGLIRSHIKNKFITHDFFMGKIREVLDHCNKVVPKMTFAKTNEMIKQEMPHLVNLAVNKDREVNPINAQEMIAKEFATHGPKMIEELFRKHIQNTTLNLYPTTSSSTTDL
ncbi:hypothetical protein Tco_1464884 [Tanacetum coccineum]